MNTPAAAWLDLQLRAAGIPIVGVRGDFTVDYDPSATPAQRSQGDALAAAFDGRDRRTRRLLDIRNDLAALSAAKKQAIWTAFLAGSPPLWATDSGPNAAALAVLQMFGASVSLSPADVLEAKIRAVAMYVQDNPLWLVNPAFDPALNVPGAEPA